MTVARIVLLLWMLVPSVGYSQSSNEFKGVVINKEGARGLVAAELIFSKGSTSYRDVSDQNGCFSIASMPDGVYTLTISHEGKLVETQTAVAVNHKNEPLVVTVLIHCPYQHIEGQMPACINGHRDGLIPVVYGLPGPRMAKQAKAGRIRLGGCVHSDCEPSYYCPIHDKKL